MIAGVLTPSQVQSNARSLGSPRSVAPGTQPVDVTLYSPSTLEELGRRWQAFEATVPCSFFQSWAWVGCLAAERFTQPVLVEAHREGEIVAMALCNRRRRTWPDRDRLLLGESGISHWDSVFVEHNGILVAPDDEAALGACLAGALRRHALVLSGTNDAHFRAAGAIGAAVIARRTRHAPRVHLTDVAASGRSYLDHLSANTRYQLRRSARRYEQAGPLRLERANNRAMAHGFLDALARLHQESWRARGRPGAFASPTFVRFHHALIDRTDAVDLLRITAGEATVGYLQNFSHRGVVSAYQSGFAYDAAELHAKPGMTCHQLAIERSLTDGMDVYDFLAGDDRYKTSLATGAVALHWITLAPPWSWPGVAGRLKSRIIQYISRRDSPTGNDRGHSAAARRPGYSRSVQR